MMRPLFDIATLKSDIEGGALILTSNNRLATKIRQAWGMYKQEQHQQQCGNACWPQPEIYAIEQWINEQWLCCCDAGSEFAAKGSIISQTLEQILWEEVIENDSEKPDTLLPSSYSKIARNSYSIIQRWQIPLSELKQELMQEFQRGSEQEFQRGAQKEFQRDPKKELQPSTPVLSRWIQMFRNKLKQHQLITPADSVSTVINAYEDGSKTPLSHIITVGFDSIPPLYQTLLSTVASKVSQHNVGSDHSNQPTTTAKRTHFYDEQQELTAAAAWAEEKQRENPNHRIGIVIPELARIRGQVERIFRQQLEPSHQLPSQPRSAPPFNISAGIPLSNTPMVSAALLLLSLNRQKLPLESLCRLLNTPFWGNEQTTPDQQILSLQTNIRAAAEKKLRYLARHELSSTEFRYQLHLAEQDIDIGDGTTEGESSITESSKNVPIFGLSSALEHMESLKREMPKKASFQQWLSLFQQQLDIVNWPGQRSLDSIEYQQYQHWLRTLEQYQSLDKLQLNVSLLEALRQLRQLTDHCIFQAETEDAPIQILGLLESSSLRFDHLWVTGMDNHSWPPSIAPNPLLPISLQRKYGTPRSQPERELQLAQTQVTGLKQSADNVIFSYSEFDATRLRRASTLIEDLPEATLTTIAPENLFSSASAESIDKLEKIDCEYAPPLHLTGTTLNQDDSQPYENIRGGSSIFKDQATCPFNAFARHRLGAQKPPEPLLGLSSMDRGSLLHGCLERLWQQLGCQQQLLALTDQGLTELTNEVVTTVLQRWKKKRPDLFGPEFTKIEQQRLVTLLKQWLELEKTRPDFEVVAFEQITETNFAGLPLKLIIDRIDELQEGNQIIIDYKTGSANTNSWLSDRPEQPQLPLYVLCSESPVAAATFAVINVSQQQFVGFSETPNLLPNVQPPGKKNEPESWGDLLNQWQQSLTKLASEFKQGYAAVTLFKPTAMQYQQELEPLNRLAELSSITARMDENQ